jgi:O-antigen/teichoic acid export membrane protein
LFQKIVHTLGSRVIISMLNVVLLLISTRLLGAEVKGEVSLLVLNFSLATLVSGFLGGPALVYLTPRFPIKSLLFVNLVWTLFSVTGFLLVLVHFDLIPDIPPFRFFRMAIIESIVATNLMIILGKEDVKLHNIIQVIKLAITVILLYLFIQLRGKDLTQFVNAYEWSLIVSFIFSSLIVMRSINWGVQANQLKLTFFETLSYGSIVQFGNIAQLLNYRFSYYVLELVVSPPQQALIRIGIYSAAIQVAESLWQFTRSVNTVQYSVISNMKNRASSLALSMKLLRINYSVTFLGILVLMLIPVWGFKAIFGEEFGEIKSHILILSPGILALSFSGAINHFFSGVGDHKFNSTTSIIGLMLTIGIAYPSILYFDSLGAAAATSVVYIVQAILQIFFIKRKDKIDFKDLIISKADIDFILRKIN